MQISELVALFFTSAGPGGIVVIFVMGLAATVYFWLTSWIIKGDKNE